MTIRETGFHESAAASGATFVEYEGYWLPSLFSSVSEEYEACRNRAVVMDLSPLRKFEVTGPGAASLLQATVTRDLSALVDGQVVYTAMCTEGGAVFDDGTVFRFGPTTFRWIGYTDEDGDWLRTHAARLGLEVEIVASTDEVHNLAVQGPASREIVAPLFHPAPGQPPVEALSWFRFTTGQLGSEDGPSVLVSRTGYSGELGYEIFCHPADGAAVWAAVWEAGRGHGLRGLGLDALDVVRIEAGLIFRGYEYTGEQDPFEAGIGFTVPRAKVDDFVGKDALARRRESPRARFVGLTVTEPEALGGELPTGPVRSGDDEVGVITSACDSPFVGAPIAFARVVTPVATPGRALAVSSSPEGNPAVASVVRVPFYDPEKSRPRS